jgi:hypothetical protein
MSERRERKLNLGDMRPASSRRDVSLVLDETFLENRIAAKELGNEWHSILPRSGTTGRRYKWQYFAWIPCPALVYRQSPHTGTANCIFSSGIDTHQLTESQSVALRQPAYFFQSMVHGSGSGFGNIVSRFFPA